MKDVKQVSKQQKTYLATLGLKRCYTCQVDKSFIAFSQDRKRADGLRSHCRQCAAAKVHAMGAQCMECGGWRSYSSGKRCQKCYRKFSLVRRTVKTMRWDDVLHHDATRLLKQWDMPLTRVAVELFEITRDQLKLNFRSDRTWENLQKIKHVQLPQLIQREYSRDLTNKVSRRFVCWQINALVADFQQKVIAAQRIAWRTPHPKFLAPEWTNRFQYNALGKVGIFLDAEYGTDGHGTAHDFIADPQAANPLETLLEREAIQNIISRLMRERGMSIEDARRIVVEHL